MNRKKQALGAITKDSESLEKIPADEYIAILDGLGETWRDPNAPAWSQLRPTTSQRISLSAFGFASVALAMFPEVYADAAQPVQ